MPDATEFATYARLLRLTPVSDVQLAPTTLAVETPNPATRPRRRLKLEGIVSFLLLVALPTCLAVTYFAFFAADRYESEARFILRSPGRTISAQLPNLLQAAGIARASDDGYIVQEFLQSRDALEVLEKNADLKAAYAAGGHDFLWKFPNFFTSRTEEGLYWHYQRMMSAEFDNTTGVSTLKMQAFAPEAAQRLAAALLVSAEGLVNRLNERARQDAIKVADSEVERMKARALAAQAALTAFRERERLVDPSQVTLAVLETIARLSVEAATLSVQIAELEKTSRNSPQIAPLRSRRGAIEAQIATERHRLAGDAQAIAPRIAEYERLMLEREFAAKALIAAMTALETAKIEAQRQQVYLEKVATPARQDYPTYPWRVVWCLVTLVAGYMTWRMWRILVKDAADHAKP
ncbi:capsule biosynthesis protein [Reyranella sp.]|uniref:capsule biosynthesis protein n=1 Tax=Reyranella sp. TaxID=1929291 RepID=UPI00122A8C90|nr:capsule biosynthesis protein [Reyranella sp.]TAJ90985.1 MAG: capsule biosynthesis protein [Reyranella sp.]